MGEWTLETTANRGLEHSTDTFYNMLFVLLKYQTVYNVFCITYSIL